MSQDTTTYNITISSNATVTAIGVGKGAGDIGKGGSSAPMLPSEDDF